MNIILNRLKYYYRRVRRFWRIFNVSYSNIYELETIKSEDHVILFVAHSAMKGGAPMLGCHIIEELKKKNYKVVIIVIEPGELLTEYISLGYVYIPWSKKTLKRFLNRLPEWKAKWCIGNSCLTGEYAEVIVSCGFQLVTLVHEMKNTIKTLCAVNYIDSVFNYSARIVFPSKVVLESCISLFRNVDMNKVMIRPQGIYQWDYPIMINKYNAKNEIAKKYNFDSSKKLVINIGGVCRRKGFDLFMESCRNDTENIYMWVGISDNNYYNEFMKTNKKLPDNFIPVGFIDNVIEIGKIYEAADVLAMTSREDPFPSVVLESFSFGTPVIAFNHCGGFIDIIDNGETGYLCDSISVLELISKIKLLFSNNGEYCKMSANCRSVAKNMRFANYVEFIERLFIL